MWRHGIEVSQPSWHSAHYFRPPASKHEKTRLRGWECVVEYGGAIRRGVLGFGIFFIVCLET
jgi:hypothetical protein